MAVCAAGSSLVSRDCRRILSEWKCCHHGYHLTRAGRHFPELVRQAAMVRIVLLLSFSSTDLARDWYHSAQAVRQQDKYYDATDVQPELESDDNHAATTEQTHKSSPEKVEKEQQRASAFAIAASKELQIHELAALASCFIFPMIGTWLLHTIRSKLSRPSEGLVSNYNLTIFLLAAEIRPFAHLLRMVQARTLHLQRTVSSSSSSDEDKIDTSKVADLSKRLEELETHVAEAATERLSADPSNAEQSSSSQPQERDNQVQSLVSQASTEIRKSIQPEIDVLNRAVRRYEKRTAVSSFETDTRFQALEAQVRDAVSLAVAAQRPSRDQLRGFLSVFLDWVYAVILIPVQIFLTLTGLPFRVVTRCLEYCRGFFLQKPVSSPTKRSKGKTPQDRVSPSPRRFKKVSQQVPTDGTGLKTIQEHS